MVCEASSQAIGEKYRDENGICVQNFRSLLLKTAREIAETCSEVEIVGDPPPPNYVNKIYFQSAPFSTTFTANDPVASRFRFFRPNLIKMFVISYYCGTA